MGDKTNYTSEPDDNEPGACKESMLITTDTIEEISHEINDLKLPSFNMDNKSNINEIQSTSDKELLVQNKDSNGMSKSDSFCSSQSREMMASTSSLQDPAENIEDSEDFLNNPAFLCKKTHLFILSSAGKPIYSLHGQEDKLATLFGVMQALVSVVQANNDAPKSIHAMGTTIVFLVKGPIILVAVSRRRTSVPQIQMQLTDVYNQILSILTLSHMTKIFEKRKNFDLRRLLAGSERLIDHLLVNDKCDNRAVTNNPFTFLTHSVRILPLNPSIRDSIISAIQNNCCKIKNLVFAVLIADNKLIALVRMKKYFIHPADLRLIFNLIECSESFKSAESWTPICLPKFDSNGFLHAHVSYLSDDCQACLLLLSVDQDVFFTLSEAKKKITEKLRRSNCLEAINEAMKTKAIKLDNIGIPEIRHFIYKSKSNAQLLCSEITTPYRCLAQFERLETIYFNLHHRIHNPGRPTKLIFEMKEMEIVLAWVTQGYELYAAFEPTVDKTAAITLVNKLLKWIKKEENSLFILTAPTF